MSSSSREARSLAIVAGQAGVVAPGAPAWMVSLFVGSLALWIGAAVFFSAAVLPILFTSLAPSEAGRIAALIFPVYFRAGLAIGLMTCVAAGLLARSLGGKWKVVLALLVLMTFAQGWTAVVIHPEMARIRGVEAEVARFQELHQLSVRLNAVVLGGGLLLLGASGFLLAGLSSPARRRELS